MKTNKLEENWSKYMHMVKIISHQIDEKDRKKGRKKYYYWMVKSIILILNMTPFKILFKEAEDDLLSHWIILILNITPSKVPFKEAEDDLLSDWIICYFIELLVLNCLSFDLLFDEIHIIWFSCLKFDWAVCPSIK